MHFYTDGNSIQRKLYGSLGAVPLVLDDEPRPDDMHLIIDVNKFVSTQE